MNLSVNVMANIQISYGFTLGYGHMVNLWFNPIVKSVVNVRANQRFDVGVSLRVKAGVSLSVNIGLNI